jgi:ribosomal protein L11 methyltransferase
MEWLDGLDLEGKTVIDYGCGSGILAVAALLLGAREAYCVDNDPQALTATRSNAERNGVAGRVHTFMPEDMPVISADVIVANILAGPLAMLAPTLTSYSHAGTQIALSGIIRSQVDELCEVYRQWFDMDGLAIKDEDWCRLSGTRRG